MSPVVEALGVRRTFRVGDSEVGLWNATLSIDSGELVAVVGPSGSGKSTLMNLMGLLDTPDSGTLSLFGADVRELDAGMRAAYRGSRIAFVFQSFHLATRRTVAENVSDGMLFSVRRAERGPKVREALNLVGLSTRSHQRVETLSGGERQRVAVARALAKSPGLLLADEPTGNLDSANGDVVFQLLRDVAARGTAVVIVTHDQELAGRADRSISVSDGHAGPTVS